MASTAAIVGAIMDDTGALQKTIKTLAARPGQLSSDQLLEDRQGRMCLKAWLATRFAVGVLGLAMPVLLLAGNWWLATTGEPVRGSLSAHYHSSGVRDIFVGIMVVTGVFLITYRVNERTWENGLTVVAGLAGIIVALFPTWRDDPAQQLVTDWVAKLNEPVAARIHLVAAVIFIVSLAVVSLIFAHRDSDRVSVKHYRRWHLLLGWAMLATVSIGLVLKLAGMNPTYGLLAVEIICTGLFGLSWLLKGVELRVNILNAEAKQRRQDADARTGPTSPTVP